MNKSDLSDQMMKGIESLRLVLCCCQGGVREGPGESGMGLSGCMRREDPRRGAGEVRTEARE